MANRTVDPLRNARELIDRAHKLQWTNLAEAAALAGEAASLAETQLTQEVLHTRIEGDNHHEPLRNLVILAARSAGELYERLGNDSPAHLLTASQYFDLAAKASLSPNTANRLKRRSTECHQTFDKLLPSLKGKERIDALIAKTALEIGLSTINSADERIGVRLDNISLKQRGEELQWNCQRVVPVTVARLANPESRLIARETKPGEENKSLLSSRLIPLYEWAYGAKFKRVTTQQIREQLAAKGEGAYGLLTVKRSKSGHVTTVAQRNGLTLEVEAQSNRISVIKGKDLAHEENAEYRMLVVRDPSRHILKVDEEARALEILNILDTQEYRKSDNVTPVREAYGWCPKSVRDAMQREARSGFANAPWIEQARRTAMTTMMVAEKNGHGQTGLKAAVESLGLSSKSKTNGIKRSAGMDSRKMHVDMAEAFAERQTALCVDEDGKATLLTNIDGYIAQIDVKTGQIVALPPQDRGSLFVVDLSPGTDHGKIRSHAAKQLGLAAPALETALSERTRDAKPTGRGFDS